MPLANRLSLPVVVARLVPGVVRPAARLAALAMLVSAGGCAAAAVSPSTWAQVGPAPGHAVYDTDLRVDLAGGTLGGRSTIRYVATDSTSRQVALLLAGGLRVQSVTGPAVRGYRVEPSGLVPEWNTVRIDLSQDVAPSSVVELRIAWTGRPAFPSDTSNRISPEFVELNLDSQWHPVFAGLNHVMTGVLRVGLPAGWRVAASGPVTYSDGAYVVRNAIPQVDVAFLAAPAFQERQSPRFTALYRGVPPAGAEAILGAAESCAQYLDARFGASNPLPRGTLVIPGRSGSAYARKNYVVLSQANVADSVALHAYLCHELAHYWTRSAGSFSPHHWMTETFAEYTAACFLRERFGAAAFQSEVARWEQTGRAHGPVWTPESTRRPTFFAMYRRGPWLLSRLEERIGTERFDRFLRRYMTEAVRTTPELLERLEAVAGAEAAQWFRDELARGPTPAS